MKLITLHQPWASLVFAAHPLIGWLKRNETRHWSTDYRGELLIHAATKNHAKSPIQSISLFQNASPNGCPKELLLDFCMTAHELPVGVVLGKVELNACRQMIPSFGSFFEESRRKALEISIADQHPAELATGLWEPGRYAFNLGGDRQLLPQPIPWRSRLGKLLPVPDDIREQVRSQLG